MADMMVRRGPDDSGLWSEDDEGTHFGFRRLAIIDRSEAGHQPMVTDDGRSALVFNGEIYNQQELRRRLENQGVRFRGTSDTEVLLQWLHRHGRDGLRALNGMFAIAFADRRAGTVLLARDHAAIKPLHYAVEPNGPGVAFSSRYDALFLTGWLDVDDVDPDSLSVYLEFMHVAAPLGLHRNTGQVEAGSYVLIDDRGLTGTRRWWFPPVGRMTDLSGRDAVDAAGAEIDAAVRRQLHADVDVGVFLSSGIDSPVVAAAVSAAQPGLESFTVGSDEPGWAGDEREGAARYAKALDLGHTESTIDGEADRLVDDAIAAAHEPMGDYSLLPTLAVSELAASSVTVALSGDGGDELFFGYERPVKILRGWPLWLTPQLARRAAVAAGSRGLLPKVDAAIASPSPGSAYRGMHGRTPRDIRGRLTPGVDTQVRPDWYEVPQPIRRGTLVDFARRVEYDLQLQRVLKKMDMASMHHSLEVRVPLLDRDVVELSYRIDIDTHLAGWRRKAVLVDLLQRRVPPSLLPTTKQGFGSPLSDWLNGPLRDRVDAAMGDGLNIPGDLVDHDAALALWRAHQEGTSRTWIIWALLSLHWWTERVRALAAPSSTLTGA